MIPAAGAAVVSKSMAWTPRECVAAFRLESRIGHNRPGVPGGPGAKPAPSVEEAETMATALTRQIEELRKAAR